MAITDMTVDTYMDVALRDTAGSVLKVCRVSGGEGTYDEGGVIFDPAWFGLTNISFVSCQNDLAMDLGEGGLVEVCRYHLSSETDDAGGLNWRWRVSVLGEGGYSELPSGQSVTFPEGQGMTIMLIGS